MGNRERRLWLGVGWGEEEGVAWLRSREWSVVAMVKDEGWQLMHDELNPILNGGNIFGEMNAR